jgi:hypothetical protein
MLEYSLLIIALLFTICFFLYRRSLRLESITKEQEKVIKIQKEIADVRKNHVENSLSDNIDLMRKGEFK